MASPSEDFRVGPGWRIPRRGSTVGRRLKCCRLESADAVGARECQSNHIQLRQGGHDACYLCRVPSRALQCSACQRTTSATKQSLLGRRSRQPLLDKCPNLRDRGAATRALCKELLYAPS